jgi:hypothetical protein
MLNPVQNRFNFELDKLAFRLNFSQPVDSSIGKPKASIFHQHGEASAPPEGSHGETDAPPLRRDARAHVAAPDPRGGGGPAQPGCADALGENNRTRGNQKAKPSLVKTS